MKQNLSKPPAPRGRPSRKPEIVRATEELLRTRGLASVTTRAIAQHVGCSEGAIYVHFTGRHELLLAVLESALPEMLSPLDQLQQSVGKFTPERNLLRALDALYNFQERILPMLASLFAEPELLNSYRKTFAAHRKGPQGAIARLTRYITDEQALKRLPKTLDTEAAATALSAGIFFRCFLTQFFLESRPTERDLKRLIASALPKA
jgi:AcrR family transcriptional regulator